MVEIFDIDYEPEQGESVRDVLDQVGKIIEEAREEDLGEGQLNIHLEHKSGIFGAYYFYNYDVSPSNYKSQASVAIYGDLRA